MRGRVGPALALVMVLANAAPAAAWDPFASEGDVAPSPAPADPAPLVVTDGLYLVTDVYTGNAVTTSGNTTSYTTTTTHQTPGTYARVIDTVGTGAASAYDGSSLNGRTRLPDGRAVAGTYYQDYVLSSAGYVSVNIVFFQDDSITVAVSAPTAAPPSVAPPGAVSPSAGRTPPTTRPVPTAAPMAVPTPRQIAFAAGVALAQTAPALASVEVLRGRQVTLWPRAFADGVPVPVRTWRLVSGNIDVASRRSGDGSVPCVATWLILPAAGTAWQLRFEITTDAAPGRVLVATVAVLVRSPGLEQ